MTSTQVSQNKAYLSLLEHLQKFAKFYLANLVFANF
jgi:hypothetical protein